MDACLAWKWLCRGGANTLSIDLNRCVFYGGSGGGNIVLGSTLRLLDEGAHLPAVILPVCPMIDDRGITVSRHEIIHGGAWGKVINEQAWRLYICGLDGEMPAEVSSYTAPARRSDFRGLPPVFTYVGDLDLFRDETIDLVKNLTQSGVPVSFTLYPGCYHGFEGLVPNSRMAQQAQRSMYEYLHHLFYGWNA